MGIYIKGHIEPCPVCGARVEHYYDHDGMLGCTAHCGYGLVYEGDESLEMHNRLSRLTGCAVEFVEANGEVDYLEDETWGRYKKAQKALHDAVRAWKAVQS